MTDIDEGLQASGVLSIVPTAPSHNRRGSRLIADPEVARDMQRKKNESYKAKRAEAQAQRRLAAGAVLGDAAEDADHAAHSERFDDTPIEDIARTVVRRMGKIVLLGGPTFAPLTLGDATTTADAWSKIALREAQARRGLNADEETNTSEEVAESIRKMTRDFAKRAKRTG